MLKLLTSARKLFLICAAVLSVFLITGNKTAQGAEQKITVLNPLGTPPLIKVKQMAPRLDTLDGKTIYFINTGFPNSGRLLKVMSDWFKTNYPSSKTVMARGGMTNIPQNVIAEMGKKADAIILGVGH